MTEKSKSFIFYIPFELSRRIDEVAKSLGISRSACVRKCLDRDLNYILQRELSTEQRFNDEVQADHSSWIIRNANASTKKERQTDERSV